MATELDTRTQSQGLVRRAGSTVRTALDADATPAARRSAMLKTAGVASATMIAGAAGVDGLVHSPQLLQVVGNGDLLAGGVGAGVAATAGLLMTWHNATCSGIDSELPGIRKVFHTTGSVGYLGALIAGVGAAAAAAAGVTGALPGDGALVAGAAGVAAFAGGAGMVARGFARAWAPKNAPALGE